MQHRTMWAFASALVLVVAGACGGGSEPAPAPAADSTPAPSAAAIDPATAGNIRGTITLEGAPPEAETIRMASDPACAAEAGDDTASEYYVVGDAGGLGNVFVHVTQGLEGRSFPEPAEAVVLDQDGCRYRPHVFGIQVGQTLEVVNNDPTLHNIHARPAVNEEFNTGQPIEGMRYERVFTETEVMVPFKCDVHGWMNAFAGVVDHPFFAVTAADGGFDLSGLPPGDYVVEAWHEELGSQTQNVTVGESATAELNFTFTAG